MARHHRQEESAHGCGCCHHVSRWPLPPAIAVFGPASLMPASGAELLTASSRGAFFWFADFQRGAFLLAGAVPCRRSGPERPGSAARDSTQSGAVTRTEQQPADRQKHQQARKAQGTPPPADRQKPPPEQRTRATGQTGTATSQRHHQDGRPATRPGQQERHDKQQQT